MKALDMLEVIDDAVKTFGNLDVVLIADDCEDANRIKVETVEVFAARVDGREVLAFVSVSMDRQRATNQVKLEH